MKITCESCAAQHELDPPSWVLASGRPFRFRCSSCGHSQMVAPPTTLALPADSPLHGPTPVNTTERLRSGVGGASKSSAVPTPPRPPVSEPSREPSPEDHHVYLRQEDKVYLVKDWATLQRWIMERRVGRDDEVSEGGVHWEAVGGKPELGSFFLAIEQIEAAELAGLTSAATPVRPGRRAAAPSGLARLDDDTEGVPVGLPPLPTEDLDDSSDEGASAAAVPPSRLMSASTPPGSPVPWTPEDVSDVDAVPRARPAPTPEVLAGRAYPANASQAGTTNGASPDTARSEAPPATAATAPPADAATAPLAESPPPPDDALLQEDPLTPVDVGPHPDATSAAAASPPTPDDGDARPAHAPIPPPGPPPQVLPPTSTSDAPGDEDDFDPDDPFGAFDTPPPAAGPSLPPGPPPPARGSALVLWLATAALVAAVLAMLGWAVATGRLGGAQGPARPTPVPIETVPAAPPAGASVADPQGIEALPADTDTDTDAADTDTDADAADTDLPDTDVPDTDAAADGPSEPTPAPPVATSPEPPSQPAAAPAPRPAAPPRPSAASITDRGFAQLDQRDFASAAQTFRDATARDPKSARAHFGLGYALAELGRNDESARALCRASTLNPGALKAEIDTVLRRTGQSCP